MGLNIVQKILKEHEHLVDHGSKISLLIVDLTMVQDGAADLILQKFSGVNAPVISPQKIVFVIDHISPASNVGAAQLHKRIREFCTKHKIKLFDIGEGICHQVLIESGAINPGMFIVGGESHTPMFGALNTIAVAAGSTDLTGIMITDLMWTMAPEVFKVELKGKLAGNVSAKDLAFFIISTFSLEYSAFSNYIIEYCGEGVASLNMNQRFTLCNMATEMGAISAVMPYDEVTAMWMKNNGFGTKVGIAPDEDAQYEQKIEIQMEEVREMIVFPHDISNVDYLAKVKDIKIDQAVIGTCSAGQFEDYYQAAEILKGKTVKARLMIVISSKKIYKKLMEMGILETFIDSGAVILPPGCGPCVGAHMGVMASGETVITTSNRNYKGIMGSTQSGVYLASPVTVARSALRGKISKAEDNYEN